MQNDSFLEFYFNDFKGLFKPITDYAYTKHALEALSSATLCVQAVCGVDSDWLNAVIISRKYINRSESDSSDILPLKSFIVVDILYSHINF